MNQQELYQKLYDDTKRKYGQAEFDRCPGVRLFPLYEQYLYGKIVDFGCGSGDTVTTLRGWECEAIGYDFIRPTKKYCFRHDITKPIATLFDVYTGLCIDVFEHLSDKHLKGLIDNLEKCKRQIISIHNGPSTEGGGVELHINKKSFAAWERLLDKHFEISKKIKIHAYQKLYICERRKGK